MLFLMSKISADELRKLVEWARNNGRVTEHGSGEIRIEHEGKSYLLPAELLKADPSGSDAIVDLDAYRV